MYNNVKKALCGLCCLFLAVFCGCAKTQDAGQRIILRYAQTQPDDHPQTQAAQEFSRLVDMESDGRIQIRIYLDGEPADEKEAARQVRLGGMDFSCISAETLQSEATRLQTLGLPYLFENNQKMWELLDGETGQEYLESLSDTGVVGLAFYQGGTQHLYTRRQTFSPAELESLRLLTCGGAFENVVALLQARPVSALQQKAAGLLEAEAADGGESDLLSYWQTGIYKQAPYLLLTGHRRELQILIASPYTIQQLSREEQALILGCAQRAAQYERELFVQQEEQARIDLKQAGVVFTELNEASAQAFRTMVQPLYAALTQEEQKEVVRIRQIA